MADVINLSTELNSCDGLLEGYELEEVLRTDHSVRDMGKGRSDTTFLIFCHDFWNTVIDSIESSMACIIFKPSLLRYIPQVSI